jgi:hypothetical protein
MHHWLEMERLVAKNKNGSHTTLRVSGYELSKLVQSAEDHADRFGPFQSDERRVQFMFYERCYPIWPTTQLDGVYSYAACEDRDDDFVGCDITLPGDELDPLYYTPARRKSLRKFFNAANQSESHNLQMMRGTNNKASDAFYQKEYYRQMVCDMINIPYATQNNEFVQSAIVNCPMFQLDDDRNSERYKQQMQDFFYFSVCPQKCLILEAMTVMKELGIYHLLDCSTWIDLFEYSMFHPNVVVCQGCRRINFIYNDYKEDDSQHIVCMTYGCKYQGRRRDMPMERLLALPLHGFNLKHYYNALFN